ncbi:MAG: helix-turn-helix transcriptional regulator [Deltaproteobacteria bacterium]|nr:helix-turn-helix transcriptional regulator [Deltaproteobacteria bacterium]
MKHRKFKKVGVDNKKKVFHLEYTSGLKVECPYSALGIRSNVVEAWPDPEVGFGDFYFKLEDGNIGYVPYDQPLHIVQNPDYVKHMTLYEVTKQVNILIKESKVSKRELARRLGTSMSQLGRLLDTTNYKKELSRLIEIATMLNYEFKWSFKKAA